MEIEINTIPSLSINLNILENNLKKLIKFFQKYKYSLLVNKKLCLTPQMKTIPGPCARTFKCFSNITLLEAYCEVATRTGRHGTETAPGPAILTRKSLPEPD